VGVGASIHESPSELSETSLRKSRPEDERAGSEGEEEEEDERCIWEEVKQGLKNDRP
jgi:hypothetical protein